MVMLQSEKKFQFSNSFNQFYAANVDFTRIKAADASELFQHQKQQKAYDEAERNLSFTKLASRKSLFNKKNSYAPDWSFACFLHESASFSTFETQVFVFCMLFVSKLFNCNESCNFSSFVFPSFSSLKRSSL